MVARADARLPEALTVEEVRDYAVQALAGLRGLRRGDKMRVITRMRRMAG